VYAFDDTTPDTGSVGGKVAALTGQAPPNIYSGPQSSSIIWSATSTGSYDGGVSIWGIDETSTASSPSPNASSTQSATSYAGQQNCNGNMDGQCDTNNIDIYYRTFASPPVTTPSFYAAGLCKALTNPSSDWYLPAICEMGPASNGSGCPAGQNMLENLSFLIGDPTQGTPGTSCSNGVNCLAGNY